MAIDLEITARLAEIATTLEVLAGIDADSALKRDTTITARLKRINDSIQSGALEAHTLTSHPDVTAPSPADGDFFRYNADISAWINDTMALSDATDVNAIPTSGNYLRGNGSIWSESVLLLTDLPAISLDDLSDVSIVAPISGNILRYDAGTNLWFQSDYFFQRMDDVSLIASGTGYLVHSDGTSTTNDTFIQAIDLLLRDGSIPLTANWPAGDFDITARGLRATNDTDDVSYDAIISTVDVTETGTFASRVYRGLLVDIDYEYSGAFDNTTVVGLEIDVDLTTAGASGASPHAIKAVIRNDANTVFAPAIGGVPFIFRVENNKTNQAFLSGAISLQLDAGTTSGGCVSTQSFINGAGSGDMIAYLGFTQADTGFSGNAVGLKAFISSKNTAASLTGVSSLPSALGTQPAKDLIMTYFGDKGHILASQASLFVTSTLRATPNAVPTTHLTPTNFEGAGYFEGLLEVDGTLFADGAVDIVGDTKFTTAGGGLPYGEIWVEGNATSVTLNTAALVQITDFDTDGDSNQITPDHTNDHITVDVAGVYLCTVSMAVLNNAAQQHIVHFMIQKNNGAVAFENVHSHRTLSGGSTDIGSISLSGVITLSANDTVELWADTDAAGDRDVTVEDCTMSLVQIGA